MERKCTAPAHDATKRGEFGDAPNETALEYAHAPNKLEGLQDPADLTGLSPGQSRASSSASNASGDACLLVMPSTGLTINEQVETKRTCSECGRVSAPIWMDNRIGTKGNQE